LGVALDSTKLKSEEVKKCVKLVDVAGRNAAVKKRRTLVRSVVDARIAEAVVVEIIS
jgi:hypothetical protein